MSDTKVLVPTAPPARATIVSIVRFLALRVWTLEVGQRRPGLTMADFLAWFRNYSRDVLLPQVTGQDVVDILELLGEAPHERPAVAAEGLTLAEFAAWFGCDHRTIGKSVMVVPPGPLPPLPPGKVPARQVGNVRRIFKADVLGQDQQRGGRDGDPAQAAPGSGGGSKWYRQMDRLRSGDAD
jgi:hypothetical protein